MELSSFQEGTLKNGSQKSNENRAVPLLSSGNANPKGRLKIAARAFPPQGEASLFELAEMQGNGGRDNESAVLYVCPSLGDHNIQICNHTLLKEL